jgi:hypothetical protein
MMVLYDNNAIEALLMKDLGESFIVFDTPLQNTYSYPAVACLVSTLIGENCPGNGTRCAILMENGAIGDTSVRTYADWIFNVGDSVAITDRTNWEYSSIVSQGSIGLADSIVKGFAAGWTYLVVLPVADSSFTFDTASAGGTMPSADPNLGESPAQANTALVVVVLLVLMCVGCGAAMWCTAMRKSRKEQDGSESEKGNNSLNLEVVEEGNKVQGSEEMLYDIDNHGFKGGYNWTTHEGEAESDHHIEATFESGVQMQADEAPVMYASPEPRIVVTPRVDAFPQ